MYKYREVTSMHEGCPAMCGDPSNWIGWAMDKEDADRLMMVSSENGIVWAGSYWDKCLTIADILNDSEDSMHKYFKLGAVLGDSISNDAVSVLVGYDTSGSNRVHNAWFAARVLLGHRPYSTCLIDQREYFDNINLYWYGDDEIPPHILMIAESFYYDYLTEMCLDDCEMVCVPNYYAEGFHAREDLCADCGEVDLRACEEWLHSTNRLDHNEMLILYRVDGYPIGDLMGFDAVHNAIRNYMEYMDSDFATMSSDVTYTIEDVICSLKEGNYRFNIDGNLLD